jgi:hypothetical protein
MSPRSSLITIVCGTAILLGVLAGVFALAWHKTITGGEAMGVVTTIIGIGAVAVGATAGTKAASTGAQSVAAALPPAVATRRSSTSST